MEKGIAVLCGTDIPEEAIFKPVAQRAGRGSPIFILDGENSFRSKLVARYARAAGLDPRDALANVKISRAFTCYQLAELITTRLSHLVNTGCAGIVCLGLLATLNDEDVPLSEAQRLLRDILAELRRLSPHLPILITVRPPPSAVRNRIGLAHTLLQHADFVYVFQPTAANSLPAQAAFWPSLGAGRALALPRTAEAAARALGAASRPRLTDGRQAGG